MIRKRFYVYREEAGGEGGAGGTTTTADATTTTATTTAAATSLLATGATATGEQAPADFIPEKLRVMKDDGTMDLDASSRKMADAYGSLEKRFGAGEAPPKTAAEYVVTVPDNLKEAFDPATDTGMQGFLTGALEQGLNQKQVDFVMSKYFEMAPVLAAGAQQFDTNTATAELKKTWATDADFSRNVRNAYAGANAAAQKAGLNIDEVMAPGGLGNNPMFMRLMAALGPEFNEDPGAGSVGATSQEDIQSLMASEAYTNPRHVDHAKVSATVQKYFVRKHGTEAAA